MASDNLESVCGDSSSSLCVYFMIANMLIWFLGLFLVFFTVGDASVVTISPQAPKGIFGERLEIRVDFEDYPFKTCRFVSANVEQII